MDEQDGTILEKLTQVEKLLEEYERKIGLGKITCKEPDLGMSREIMLSMSAEDLLALAFEYAQYSLFLEKEIGRHKGRYYWADANLNRYLERECNNYEGWKWEERKANALNNSEYAQKLFKLKTNSKTLLERNSFLTNKINFLSELLKDAYYMKRKQEHERSES